MFVRDENRVDALEILADRLQPFRQLLHAEAGVDQDARVFGSQKCGISGTAARQHTELNDTRLPNPLYRPTSPEYT